MSVCFCRFLLAAAIVVLAIIWWPAVWAKWVIVAAGALLAITAIFYNKCCWRMKKQAKE